MREVKGFHLIVTILILLKAFLVGHGAAKWVLRLGALSAALLVAPSLAAAPIKNGDLNEDGRTDVKDVLFAQKHMLGLQELDENQLAIADLYPSPEGDGKVTASDYLLILRAAISSFDSLTPPQITEPLLDYSLDVVYEVSGLSSPGAELRVYINGQFANVFYADSLTGSYTATVILNSGTNEIEVREWNGVVESVSSNQLEIDYLVSSKVMQTGEDQSFEGHDDGDLKAGLPRRFIRDDANEIVTEVTTGLKWQDSEGAINEELTWSEARSYCSNLSLGGESWRLPSLLELAFLVDHNSSHIIDYSEHLATPMIDPIFINTFFGSNSFSGQYWSVDRWEPPYYSTMDFRNGGFSIGAASSGATRKVRCVSGSFVYPPQGIKSESGRTIIDNRMHLIWQDVPDNQTLTLDWSGALSYCATLSLEGFDDWRLPNINESYMLAYLARNHVIEYQAGGPNPYIGSDFYWWTSTRSAKHTLIHLEPRVFVRSAVYNDNQYARSLYTHSPDALLHVRCVRDYKPPQVLVKNESETVEIGSPITFDVDYAVAGSSEIVSYRWHDHTLQEDIGFEKTFVKADLSEGIHDISLSITDELGLAIESSRIRITVEVTNRPVADAGADREFSTSSSFALDASGSYSPFGGFLTYEWTRGYDYGLGNYSRVVGSSYSGATSFQLTVTDSRGVQATDWVRVTAPIGGSSRTVTVEVSEDFANFGEIIDFSSSVSQMDSPVTYVWSNGTDILSTQPAFSTAALGVGRHVIELVATDVNGNVGSQAVTVTVRYPFEDCPLNFVSDDSSYLDVNPTEDIPWLDRRVNYIPGWDWPGTYTVDQIEAAFNHARHQDRTISQYLRMPAQSDWDDMSDYQQALYLINSERRGRGLKPFEGIAPNILEVAQTYADYIRENDLALHHGIDGQTTEQRLSGDPDITASADSGIFIETLRGTLEGENYSYSSPGQEYVQAIYHWLYADEDPYLPAPTLAGRSRGEPWAYRAQLLSPGFIENSGNNYAEGLVGFAISSGNYNPGSAGDGEGKVVVFNAFDPSSGWNHDDTITVDTDGAQACNNNIQIVIDTSVVPDVDDLAYVEVSSGTISLDPGADQSFQIVGYYQDGSTIDLTEFGDFPPDAYSIVDIRDSVITALSNGFVNVWVSVNGIYSDRFLVNVGDIFVPTVNPPIASAGPDQTMFVEEQLFTFDGSSSFGSSSGIVDYEWRYMGELISNAAIFSKSDFEVGVHIVILTVIDENGQADRDEVIITVNERSYPLVECLVSHVIDDAQFADEFPNADIPWEEPTFTEVSDIERAFNNARLIDSSVSQYLVMPSQEEWDAMGYQEQGLYLINAERQARGIKPYEGISPSVNTIAQYYADYTRERHLHGGHDNDGVWPWERLNQDSIIRDNSDADIRPESLTAWTVFFPALLPSATESVVKSVYLWIYHDKDPYIGEPWAHRQHILQTKLYENSGEDHKEGLVGFGISTGFYNPDSVHSPSPDGGGVLVFNTFDPSSTWDHSSTIPVNTDSAQSCTPDVVIELSETDVPQLTQLVSITVSPTDVLLSEGGTKPLTIVGTYQNAATIDLSNNARFYADNYSVVSVAGPSITGLRQGETFVFVQAGTITSNKVRVLVGSSVDTSNLASTFGEDYLAHIPDNATLESYDPQAFAVFNGYVKDRNNDPMSGVTISFLDKPEYGSTTTDLNGHFVIAAEAGSHKIVFRKQGYLTVHRQKSSASHSWATIEDVVMLNVDSRKTYIDFSSSSPQTHTSTFVDDSFGRRATTMVFDGISSATVTSIDGSQRTLEDITVRATEYEFPESMPGALPVDSAFTYCSELEIEGLRDDDTVTFDSPVVVYVDNFLGFSVGEIVPIGYYDRLLGEWVASDNGVVVQLLDQDSDELVDGVDYTGDGVADDIDGDGSTEDEAAGLESFESGATYWRGTITHFTPFDLNWPVVPPPDAIPPLTPAAEFGFEKPEHTEQACVNSYVTPFQQVFHEDIPIVGTGLNLHYSSERTAGYHHKLSFAVSDDMPLPSSMTGIIARLDIGGRTFQRQFSATPNLRAEFIWDGNSISGERVNGLAKGRLSIGYIYETQYASVGNAADDVQALSDYDVFWAQPAADPTGVASRDVYSLWVSRTIALQNTFESHIANGWTISNYHENGEAGFNYKGNGALETDVIDLLYKGDGTVEEQEKTGLVLKTGITISQVEYDDGHYQKGGSDISYTITDDSVLKDRVTGLEWYYSNEEVRLITRPQAEYHCLSRGTGFRLPTVKEVVYTVDKGAAREHFFPAYRFGAIYAWTQSSIGDGNPKPVMCVRGENLNHRYIQGLQRIDELDVVVDGQSALMWQDDLSTQTQTMNWQQSIEHCEASTHAGFDNWRLPNINELTYVLPNSVFVNETTFEGDQSEWTPTSPGRRPYWASTPYPLEAGKSWAMESESYAYHRFDQSDLYYVRCVRDDVTLLKTPYRFDEYGRHIETLDPVTGETRVTFDHDAEGLLQTITDQHGNSLSIDRSIFGEIILRSHDGYTTKLVIDPITNDLNRVEYDDGTNYQFTYAGLSLMDWELDPNGNEFIHLFDAYGRVYQTSDPEEGQWDFIRARNSEGLIEYGYDTAEANSYRTIKTTLPSGAMQKQTTYVDGRVSTHTFLSAVAEEDGEGNPEEGGAVSATETISSCDVSTQIDYVQDVKTLKDIPSTMTVTVPDSYSAGGLVNTTVITKEYGLSGADRSSYTITTVENDKQPGMVQHLSLFDDITHRRRVTSPEGRQMIFDYDAETGLLKTITPAGGFNTTNYTYDNRGRVETITTGARTHTNIYDDLVSKGAVTRTRADDGKETSFTYDAVGRVDVVTYPDSTITDTGYDNSGNPTSVQVPSTFTYGFTYSGVDKVETETTPLAEITTYIYDRDRRLKEIIYPSGPTVRASLTYTDGVLDFSDTPEGQIDYSYGSCGGQIEAVTEVWSGEEVDYSYDGHLLIGVTYSGELNETITQQYNNSFQVSALSYAGLTMGAGDISYDDDGVLTGVHGYTITPREGSPLPQTISNTVFSQARDYNSYGELDEVATTVNSQVTYNYTLIYNDLGQITNKTETLHDGTVFNYEYIYHADRRWLTEVRRDDGAGGALITVENYSYDANGNRSIVGTPSTYNNGDQLTNNGAGTSYTYTPEGYLETKTTGGQTTTYAYSSQGRLLSVAPPVPAQAITYTHNAIGNRVAKLVGGTVVEKYLWLDKTTLLAVFNADDSLRYRFEYTLGNTATSFVDSEGDKYYIAGDHLGSPRTISDQNGNIIKAYSYDSWGNRTTLTDNNPAIDIPIGFAGGLYDKDTNLIRFGYRDYDPDVGRWTTRDPIGFGGGDANIYVYVFNDPVRFNDKLGLATDGVSINANFGAIGGGTIGIGLVSDTRGNYALQLTAGAGADTPGISVMGHREITNADSVSDLQGAAVQTSVDAAIGPLAAEGGGVVGDGYIGFSGGYGLGVGLPIGGSLYYTQTINVLEFSGQDLSGLLDRIQEFLGFGDNGASCD